MDDNKVKCQITGENILLQEAVKTDEVDKMLMAFVDKKYPDKGDSGYISRGELLKIRVEYIKEMMSKDRSTLEKLETEEELNRITRTTVSKKLADAQPDTSSFGQRLADKIAAFGGSWTFIIIFASFLLLWIAANIWLLGAKTFDPYPFILLNLILSTIAAMQAPVIMMSQNRVEAIDRKRAEQDYQVNLRAEIEIRKLYEKMDILLLQQMQHLMELQDIQIELLNEIKAERKG